MNSTAPFMPHLTGHSKAYSGLCSRSGSTNHQALFLNLVSPCRPSVRPQQRHARLFSRCEIRCPQKVVARMKESESPKYTEDQFPG